MIIQRIIVFLAALLLTIKAEEDENLGWGYFFFRDGLDYDEDYCFYQGYYPGGRMPDIQPISPPDVGAEIDNNDAMTNGMVAGAGIGGTFLTLAGDVSSKLPVFGAVFISFSTLLGVFGGGPDLATVAMQNALNELTGYINEQVDLLQDYADQRVLDYHKEYLREQFIVLYNAAINCLEYYQGSSQNAINCLQDVVIQQIDPQRVTFAEYESIMSDATNEFPSGKMTPFHDYEDMNPFLYSTRFCNEYPERCPDTYTVKDFEASAATFGRYATFHLFMLTGIFYEYMSNTEIKNSTNTVIQILEDIRNNGYFYKDYASWLYQWTYTRQYISSIGCLYRCPNPSIASRTYCFGKNDIAAILEDCSVPQTTTCDEPLWVYESGKHTVNKQTCRTKCNEFDNGYCATTLQVRVDGKGYKWQDEHSDVRSRYVVDPDNPDAWDGPDMNKDTASLIEHNYMMNAWCVNGNTELNIDYPSYRRYMPYYDCLECDLQNWWSGHLMQSAKAWGELAEAVDERLANLGYPQDSWKAYPFPEDIINNECECKKD